MRLRTADTARNVLRVDTVAGEREWPVASGCVVTLDGAASSLGSLSEGCDVSVSGNPATAVTATSDATVGAAVVGNINVANNNNSTVNTGYVDMQAYAQAMFVFILVSVDETVDCTVRQSTDTADGSGATLKSAAQLASSDDNKLVVIHVKASELTGGRRYVRGRMAVANGTTNICGAVALGFKSAFTPGASISAVAQTVP